MKFLDFFDRVVAMILRDKEVESSVMQALGLYREGSAFFERKAFDEALPKLSKAVELAPGLLPAVEKIALIYFERQEWVQAVRWLEEAIALCESKPEYLAQDPFRKKRLEAKLIAAREKQAVVAGTKAFTGRF